MSERETAPTVRSLELAAQAWCEPETSHKEMDSELATAFARILDRALSPSAQAPGRNLTREEDAMLMEALRNSSVLVGEFVPAQAPGGDVDWETKYEDLLKQSLALSAAYLRLRSLIPGAFDTPHAPSPETVWKVTEDALIAALRSHAVDVTESSHG